MSQVIDAAAEIIHIFVRIDRDTQKKIDFDHDQVTGAEIKERAGVPLEDDLARRSGQKLDLVTNTETITIAQGEHFAVFPAGTIS